MKPLPRRFCERSPLRPVPARHVLATPRIGVDFAGEWAARPLRFFDRRSPFVSAGGAGVEPA